jgi:DNA polymerase-3 subunit epsilon
MINFKKPLAIFDLETTGLSIENDRIVEIGILVVKNEMETNQFHALINPEVNIPEQASAIHNITNEVVKDAPTFKEIANDLYEILVDADLCGYNSNNFDVPFLVNEFARCGINFDVSNKALIDPCYIFKNKERRTLAGAYKFYCNRTLENAHSSIPDLLATWEVLQSQVSRYSDLSWDTAVLHEASNDPFKIDIAGKLRYDNDGFETITFGKHKGRRCIEIFNETPDYFDWILNSDFAPDTKNHVRNFLDTVG